jgi:hypothetical protein
MKKIILACVIAALWTLGAGYASDAAATNPPIKNPLLQLLVLNHVITEEQALQVEAQLNKQTSTAASSDSKPQAAAPKSDLPDILKGFKPIATFYLSYQDAHTKTTDTNSFQLKRGYFGADMDITPYLTTRFVSDVTMLATGDVELRAKYIYGKFHWKGNDAITAPYMEFGLVHTPWLDFEEGINGFRMQDTMFLERNSVFNSADIGVTVGSDLGGSMDNDYKSKVDSKYAGKYGSWQIGVYNGGGYHAAENNTNKVFEGRFTIRPISNALPGLQFSVFGVVGQGNTAVVNGVQPPDWKSFNGMVSYESQYFTFTGQGYFGTGNQAGSALSTNKQSADQKGFSVFASAHIPTPKIGGKISIFGRADEFNTDTHLHTTDIRRMYIAGLAWQFYKSNTWLFDYQRTNHRVSSILPEDRVQLTLQVGL